MFLCCYSILFYESQALTSPSNSIFLNPSESCDQNDSFEIELYSTMTLCSKRTFFFFKKVRVKVSVKLCKQTVYRIYIFSISVFSPVHNCVCNYRKLTILQTNKGERSPNILLWKFSFSEIYLRKWWPSRLF
jgi:hypothetical protein